MRKIFFKVFILILFNMVNLKTSAMDSLKIGNDFSIESIDNEYYEIIDSSGRKVKIPKNITKIIPSGANAQLILAGFVPEKMVGIAKKLPKQTLEELKNFPANKPEIGQFYGKNPNFNKEELINLSPELIIDIGEKKKNVKEDMEQITQNTGVNTIFIELTPENSGELYRILGKLFNKEEKGEEIALFLEHEVRLIKNTLKNIPENKRLSFIQVGGKALSIDPTKSSHTEAIEFAGGVNKAPIKNKGEKSKTETLNMEEILRWNPDVIFAKDSNSYEAIKNDPSWKILKAVRDKKVYLVPQVPYNWITSPPSINKMIGIYWAAQILYPEYFTYDIREIERKFNELIYGI